MFSSVVFHDHARDRGLKPILGCEVYVAPGSRFDKSGPQTETNHLVLLAETDEGYKNLIKLVVGRLHRGVLLPAAHRQGTAGAAREGAHRPEQLPEGRGGERAESGAGAAGARGRGAAARHPRPGQLLPRDAVPGHRGAEDRQPRPPSAGARAEPAARRHQRRALPAAGRLPAARHPAVHRHRQDGQRRAAPALHRRSVLPEDRRADGARSSRTIPTRCKNTLLIAERCNVTIPKGQNHLPVVRRARGLHARPVLRARRARGVRAAAGAPAAARGRAAGCATRSTSTRRVSTTRSR